MPSMRPLLIGVSTMRECRWHRSAASWPLGSFAGRPIRWPRHTTSGERISSGRRKGCSQSKPRLVSFSTPKRMKKKTLTHASYYHPLSRHQLSGRTRNRRFYRRFLKSLPKCLYHFTAGFLDRISVRPRLASDHKSDTVSLAATEYLAVTAMSSD
jgi:hypothetical protein